MASITRKPVATTLVNPAAVTAESETTVAHAEREPRNLHDEKPFSQGEGLSNLKDRLDAKIDRILPPHRKYCGLSRRVACLVVTGILLVLLALILGLSIGLSMRNKCVREICQKNCES